MHLLRLGIYIQRPSLYRYALSLHMCFDFLQSLQTLHNRSYRKVVFLHGCDGKRCEEAVGGHTAQVARWLSGCCLSLVEAPSCLVTHPAPLPGPHPSPPPPPPSTPPLLVPSTPPSPSPRHPPLFLPLLSSSLFPFCPSVWSL